MSTLARTKSIDFKKEKILQIATDEFAAKGFAGADVQLIADRADVGKGTVYRFFGNKQELFLAVSNHGMKQLETDVFAGIQGLTDPVEIFRTAGLAYASFFQKNPTLVEILIQERASFRGSIPDTHLVYRQKNRRAFEDILRQAIGEGVFRNVNVRESINAFSNVLYGTVVCGCLEGSNRKLKSMAKHAIDIFLNGLLVRRES